MGIIKVENKKGQSHFNLTIYTKTLAATFKTILNSSAYFSLLAKLLILFQY
jgi:hypothetical protein